MAEVLARHACLFLDKFCFCTVPFRHSRLSCPVLDNEEANLRMHHPGVKHNKIERRRERERGRKSVNFVTKCI